VHPSLRVGILVENFPEAESHGRIAQAAKSLDRGHSHDRHRVGETIKHYILRVICLKTPERLEHVHPHCRLGITCEVDKIRNRSRIA
jgi:hypothetical protein